MVRRNFHFSTVYKNIFTKLFSVDFILKSGFFRAQSQTYSFQNARGFATAQPHRLLASSPENLGFHLQSQIDSIFCSKLVINTTSDKSERLVARLCAH